MDMFDAVSRYPCLRPMRFYVFNSFNDLPEPTGLGGKGNRRCVEDGTIIIVDGWFSHKGRLDLGEARAFEEWLTRNSKIKAVEYHRAGRTMASFILRCCWSGKKVELDETKCKISVQHNRTSGDRTKDRKSVV